MVNQAVVKNSCRHPEGIFSKQNSTHQTHTIRYRRHNFIRACRSWFLPYIKLRLHPNEFRPILSFLYTDLNCNLDCYYCYSRGNKVEGMSMQTAIDALDWLHSLGCRVVAYMGGEPLVRKQFIIDLSLKKGEEAKLAIKDHTIHYDLADEQARIIDRTFYIANDDERVSALAQRISREDAYQYVKENMTGIMKGMTFIVGFYSRGPVGAEAAVPA